MKNLFIAVSMIVGFSSVSVRAEEAKIVKKDEVKKEEVKKEESKPELLDKKKVVKSGKKVSKDQEVLKPKDGKSIDGQTVESKSEEIKK